MLLDGQAIGSLDMVLCCPHEVKCDASCDGDVNGAGGACGVAAAADATTAGNITDTSVRSLTGALH